VSRALATPAALLGGYVLWSAAFVALYGLHGAGCELVDPARRGALRIALTAAWLAFVAAGVALAVVVIRRRRAAVTPPRHFLAAVAAGLAISAAIATAWIGLPLALTDPCRSAGPEARTSGIALPQARP
jgi:hypothetical protein